MLVYFTAIWSILRPFSIFCGHSVFLWPFGIFYSYLFFFLFWHVVPRKSGNPGLRKKLRHWPQKNILKCLPSRTQVGSGRSHCASLHMAWLWPGVDEASVHPSSHQNLAMRPSWDQCCDHYIFSAILADFRQKIGVFLKNLRRSLIF
jgi:hypothetical protein